VEVKAHPLVVVRTLVWWHLSLVEPPLKGGPNVCWNLLHGNVFGCYRPVLGGGWPFWDKRLAGRKLKKGSNSLCGGRPSA